MDEAKPRVEVVTETREELHLVEQERTPRVQKSALEAKWFDGEHEVAFSERAFKPRHGADLDEIRSFVDALEIRKRDLPPLPEIKRTELAAPPAVPDHYRAPLEAVIEGVLVGVETIHRVGTGTVVEAQWEDKQGALQRALFLVEGDTARPYDNVASRIDELPAPDAPRAEGTPAPAPADEPHKKRSRLRFGFGKK